MTVFAPGFAEAFDPELYPEALAVLADVEAALGRAVREGVTDTLQAVAARLAAPEVVVVFAGRFSSGKSTLVNALVGREVLPTGPDPETGVPCHIRSGAVERAVARYRSGEVRPVDCTQADLSRLITITDADGGVRTRVREVAEVAVTLPTRAIPRGTVWIDTPGADDGAGLPPGWTDALADADVLVWVTRSDVPLGLHEMSLLDDHIADHGTAGAVLVVNVMVPDDSPATYAHVVGRRGARLQQRARDADERRGVAIAAPILLAARPMERHGAGFGGEALCAVLGDPAELGRRARTVRLHQCLKAVDELHAQVAEAVDAEQDALHDHAAEQERATAAAQIDDEAFAQLLADLLADLVGRCRARLGEMAAAAAAGGGADACEQALGEAVDAQVATIRAKAEKKVVELCRRHLRTGPPDEVAAAVARLTADRPTLNRPAEPGVSGGEALAAAAAIAGTVLGAVLLGPFGAMAAGAIGGAAVKNRASASRGPDPGWLANAAAMAAAAAADELDADRPAALAALLGCCRPAPASPSSADTERLDALVALRDRLLEPARRMLTGHGA